MFHEGIWIYYVTTMKGGGYIFGKIVFELIVNQNLRG